jgi:hypothetical protein
MVFGVWVSAVARTAVERQSRLLSKIAVLGLSSGRGSSEMTMDAQKHPDDEDERDRRATNIFLLVAGVLVVGGGLWLVDARKNQLCLESGRRNCNPIPLPERTRD